MNASHTNQHQNYFKKSNLTDTPPDALGIGINQ